MLRGKGLLNVGEIGKGSRLLKYWIYLSVYAYIPLGGRAQQEARNLVSS